MVSLAGQQIPVMLPSSHSWPLALLLQRHTTILGSLILVLEMGIQNLMFAYKILCPLMYHLRFLNALLQTYMCSTNIPSHCANQIASWLILHCQVVYLYIPPFLSLGKHGHALSSVGLVSFSIFSSRI